MHPATRHHRRSGFTIVELLVALGIMSLLLALLLPAVQSARAAAHRTSCGNNLRQIGVALEAFESSHRRFPAGSVKSSSPAGGSLTNNSPPHVELLPFLDRNDLYERFDRTESGSGLSSDPPVSAVNGELLRERMAVFECPADATDATHCNYRVSAGTSPGMHETTPRSPTAALAGYRSLLGRRDGQFTDGKSHTAAFSEKLAGDFDPAGYTPSRDLLSYPSSSGSSWLRPDDVVRDCSRPGLANLPHFSYGGYTWVLSGYPTTWYNHVFTPNSRIPDCVNGNPAGMGAFAARSLHVGGVNVLFADGSVRFASSSIDLAVWRAAGTISGEEAVEF